ncbi:hydrogenase 2 operon protein HybA [Thermodesulfovibrionales bacterium]|nr:hydrogenase 2 operon protein HybA [Thermodesulfovibrionales bacterium]
MGINRRDFLKGAAGSGLLLAADASPALAFGPRTPKELPPDAVGILFDSTLCIGCNVCVFRCKQANAHMALRPEFNVPIGNLKIHDTPLGLSADTLTVIKLYKHDDGNHSFIKHQCMHCIDPACVSACPVTAFTKDPKTGIVKFCKRVCIGCRYCQLACPFVAIGFKWDEPFPEMVRCQLCDHLIPLGKYAACCSYCPTGAALYGRVVDLREEASRRLDLEYGEPYRFPVNHIESTRKSFRPAAKYYPNIYGDTEGGGLQVMVLAGVSPLRLGFPDIPDVSNAAVSEGVFKTIYKWFAAPIVLLGALVYLAYRNTEEYRKPKDEDD